MEYFLALLGGRVSIRLKNFLLALFFLSISVTAVALLVVNKHSVLPPKETPPRQDLKLPAAVDRDEHLRGRKALLEQQCSSLRSSNRLHQINNFSEAWDPQLLQRMWVDDKHQLIYCFIPKVACTNFKRLMMVLGGIYGAKNPLSIPGELVHIENDAPKLGKFKSKSEIKKRQETYTKFMFVRHPYDRLVSAYRNKFTSYESSSLVFQIKYGREMIRRYRLNATRESADTGRDVTFPEFVQYVIDEAGVDLAGRRNLEQHWRPFTDLCHPCSVNYDLIGKFESLHDDSEFLLNKVKADPAISFPEFKQPETSHFSVEHYMNQLSIKQLRNIYRIYRDDFKLFGYQYPK